MWRWILSATFTLLVLLVLAFALVVGTERGTAWLLEEAQAFGGDIVRVSGVSGTLLDGLRAEELRIVAGKTEIVARRVRLALEPAELLRGRVVVAALGAASVTAIVTDDERPDEPFVMPTVKLPLPVEIAGLEIDTLEVRAKGAVQILTALSVVASMRGSRLEVSRARGALAGLELQLTGEAELVPALPVDMRVEWRLAQPAISGSGSVRGELAALELEQLLRLPEPVTIRATLTNVATAPALAGTASWEALAYELPGIGPVRVERGRVSVSGWLGEWSAELAAMLKAEGYPEMQARGMVRGAGSRVVLDDLRLDGGFGALAAQGDIDLAGEPHVRLDVTAMNVNTAAFRPGLDGRLSARAAIDARVPGAVEIRLLDLEGRLMGRPLAGSGNLTWRDGTLTFADVALRAGPNRLRADGSIGERLAGSFALVAPELAVLWPGLEGSVEAKARLSGTRARPEIDLDAAGSNVLIGDARVEALDLRLRTDRRRHVDARLQSRGIVVGDLDVGNLDATVTGSLEAHDLRARLEGGRVDLQIASSGSWDGTMLRHRVHSARLAEAEFGEWHMSGEPEVAVGANALTVGPHCWEQAPSALCIAALDRSPAGTRIDAELRDLELQRLGPWLPADFAFTGMAQSKIALDVAGGTVIGSVVTRLEGATLYYTGGDEPLETHFEVARLDAQFTPGGASADLEFDSTTGLHLSGRARMSGPAGLDAPLDAEIVGRLPDLAPLVPVFAGDLDLAEVKGSVTLDTSVSGTLRAPQFTGVVRLTGGTVALTDLGVKLEGIDVALLGDGSETLRVQGSARAGGALSISGQLTPLAPGGPQGRVRVRGNRIDAVRLPDRYVQVSPNIVVHYDGGVITTEGDVIIPKADILIRELPASAASPSADAVVVDRETPAEKGEPGQIVRGEIAIVFGRDVRLRAFGLDTLLEGTVKLSQGADREPKGYGVVRLKEGKFGAYGKELTIERGTLGFAGPLDDPAVDLKASRRVDWEGKSVTAGIILSGTAKRPESRVYSEPAMSEADALSYLVSGRPMQSANANDRSTIAGAALALGVQQTSPLTERLGSAVTLDELGMQGGALDETEIVAGKQINPDLYVRFTYGLFNRIGSVLARYKIGRNLSIEAASGEDQSLDLIWSVERE